MAYQICKRCDKMFEKNGKFYCESCFEKNERELELISSYLSKHSNATVLEIITETGVSIKSINSLVEEGSINYVERKPRIESKSEAFTVVDNSLQKINKFHLRRKSRRNSE